MKDIMDGALCAVSVILVIIAAYAWAFAIEALAR